ncbi:MAG: efflux RND transporter periplasmic adaptor subunit [Desulfobulbaceae bacterium]
MIEVVGTVRPVNDALIAAKVTGTIVEMPVALGSIVGKGDLLVKISAGELSARAVQAEAQLEQARRNLEREKKLLKKNAATPESVKSLEDLYRVAEAAHREAVTMLGYTTITAPFAGVITRKRAGVGDLATPGTPLLTLEDTSRLQVEASVPETLILNIEKDQTLNVHIPVARLDITGTVTEVAPAADPLSRTATVKIGVESHSLLRSGQFARVSFPGPARKSLFVPSGAIRTFGQLEQMFVVEEGTARLRLVRTGAVTGEKTEILTGLEEGETFVVSPVADLRDGQPVKMVQ